MNLKTPTIFDIYSGEWPVKIEQMSPKPLAIITRASFQEIGNRNRFVDAHALDYIAQCKAVGIKYGLYHFLTPNGIAEQAALFLSQWNKANGADLPPIVDVEINLVTSYPHATKKGESAIGNAVWQSHIKTFLDLIAAGTGRTPMIYTNKNFWSYAMTKNLIGQFMPPTWTADYSLWVAQYPDYPDQATQPTVLPNGWTKWAIWQYHDKGRTNGFLANDLNVVSDWYAAELGNIVTPPPDVPPVVTPPASDEYLLYYKGGVFQGKFIKE